MSKIENSKKLSPKNFKEKYNKLKFLLKAARQRKKGFPFYIFFIILNIHSIMGLIIIYYFISNSSLIILYTCYIIVDCH